MANTPDYQRFRFSSQLDAKGTYPVANNDKIIRELDKSIKSALPPDAFYYIGEKHIAPDGKMFVDVYTYPQHAKIAHSAGRYVAGKGDYHVTRLQNINQAQTQAIQQIETAPARREEERKQREEEKRQNKEEQEAKKSKDASMRVLHGAILKVIAVLAGIADITRRILSSVISTSTQAVQDNRLAHNLGLSYDQVRAYRNTEIAHNMKEGTITGAIADVQNKFGNITSLDEKSLEALAVVMGSQIEDMAKMGIGASNPEAIVGAIVDAFNAKANAGYNSVGQYVGEQQARRELYSYLNKISPQIADIFATMQEELHNINSLFRGQADTFAQWKDLLPTSRGMPSTMEYNVAVTLGQEWGVIKSILEQLKQSVALSIAPTLLSVLRKISNFRIGYSEEENRKLNETNKDANTEALNQTNQTIALMESAGELSEADSFYLSALKDYKAELEKANKGNKKGNIDYAVRTPEELRVMALKKAKSFANSYLAVDYNSVTKYADMFNLSEDDLQHFAELSAVDSQEIQNILDAYEEPFDTEKERKAYKDKLGKDFFAEREKRVTETFEARKKEAEQKAYDAVHKDKTSPYYRTLTQRLNLRDTKATETVAMIENLYGIELEGDNIDKKLKDAVKRGFAYYAGNDIVKTLPYMSELFYQDEANIDKELREKYAYSDEDFMQYLYQKHKGFFTPHLQGAKYDQLKKDLETGNLYSSVFALLSTEGTLEDWRLKLPSTYTGGGTPRAYNEELDNNEVVHKIVLDYKGQTYELGSFLGMKGGTGKIGEIAVTPDGAKVITTTSTVNSQQTPASKARPYKPRSTGIQE